MLTLAYRSKRGSMRKSRKKEGYQMSPHHLFCEQCGAANTTEATVCFACQQSLQPSVSASPVPSPILPSPTLSPSGATAQRLLPGSLLNGRYKIMHEVGQGGFSVVYAAQDTHQKHKRVAIKQISLHSLTPRQVIEATDTYNREMGLLSSLKHASLPHIYDHFTGQEYWYLVMDFIEGETLEDYMHKARQGYLPVQEVLDIGIRLSGVLYYLHQQTPPIVFRDVKPANIMRTPRGRLYLIDFGIARHFRPGQRRDTGPLGSPGYAAPEQYGTTQTTAQSDIYSLGATLQTLLTGHDPLDGASTPDQPIPQKLQQLLESMLERDASKRPQNMKVVQLRLKLLKQGKRGAVLSYVWGSRSEESLVTYEQAARLAHAQAEVFYGEGVSLARLKRYEEALDAYEQVIRLDPNYAEVYYEMGASLNWLKRYEEALDAHEQAIRLDPNYAEAYYGKGVSLNWLKRYEEALDAYEQAIRLDPNHVEAYRGKGVSLSWLNRDKESVVAYEQATRLAHTQAEAYYEKGVSLAHLEGHEEALDAYEQAIRLDPTYASAYFKKGVSLSWLARYGESVTAYQRAIRLDPNYAEAYYEKGVSLVWLKRYEESVAAYEQAIRLDPNYAEAYYEMGASLNWLDRNEESVAAYEQAIRLDPDYAEAYREKGATLSWLKRYEEALDAYEQAIRLDPTDAKTYYGKGIALELLRRRSEAQQAYERARQLGYSG